MFAFVLSLMICVSWLTQAQVSLTGEKFQPAKIYGEKTFKEGGKLQIKCSTFGAVNDSEEVFNYLCKNGIGIEMKKSRDRDVIFTIDGITKDFTGNYSCVYSEKEYDVKEARGQDFESIFITVNDSFIPAIITLPEISVKEGTDVDFKCTSSKLPDNDQNNNYAYLCKNGTVIQVNIWNTEKMEAIFTLKEVSKRDAGSYTCGLMADIQPIPKTRLHGINKASLHVTENVNDTVRIVVGCSVALLLVLCCLGLYGVIEKQGWCRCHSERSTEHGAEARGGEHILYTDVTQNQPRAVEWDDFSDNSEDDHGSNEDLYQVCEDV
ncbi:uncharacterized protein LOC118818469 isoform X2 [Colossoma macropomum]|uniref:uncharacterized protein LOC118818469 isoform X2 n=1 Tax=Colossoma macropomum TaxID=42526 RepID=UPI001863D65D|nr:uncharacterized protein LOC118818469 isoform X2 [Colossoma macropomum]